RVLGYVMAGRLDVGAALVKRGALVAYTAYPFGREAAYLAAEAEARAQGRGLWADPQAVAQVDALKLAWASQRSE
ncbi:MAG: thermonuclease family protein, partial [Myxococcales bacterium]|nr:thermonuclease family protein [Myxococcales bacterium]